MEEDIATLSICRTHKWRKRETSYTDLGQVKREKWGSSHLAREGRSSGAVGQGAWVFSRNSWEVSRLGAGRARREGSTGAIVNQSWILNQPKEFGFC